MAFNCNDPIDAELAKKVLPAGTDFEKVTEDDLANGVKQKVQGVNYSKNMQILAHEVHGTLQLRQEDIGKIIRRIVSLAVQLTAEERTSGEKEEGA